MKRLNTHSSVSFGTGRMYACEGSMWSNEVIIGIYNLLSARLRNVFLDAFDGNDL